MFIHHESISARSASEMDGQGHFEVLQYGPREFVVVQGDGGMTLSTHPTLRAAVAQAKREARAYDGPPKRKAVRLFAVVELIYGQEGNPSIRLFTKRTEAEKFQRRLKRENGPDNEEVLVILQEVDAPA